MRLIFIRHGESAANAAKAVVDLPPGEGDRLTELGQAQARAAAEAIKDMPVGRLLTSPMRRAQETAEPLAGALGLQPEIDGGIFELRQRTDFGLLSPQKQVHSRWSEWMTEHPDDPDFTLEGAESFNHVLGRVHAFKRRLEQGDPNQVVLAVSHGIFQRFFLYDSLFAAAFNPAMARRMWQIRTLNCGISIFDRNAPRDPLDPPVDGWICVTWMARWWDIP